MIISRKVYWKCTSCKSIYLCDGFVIRKCPCCGYRGAMIVKVED